MISVPWAIPTASQAAHQQESEISGQQPQSGMNLGIAMGRFTVGSKTHPKLILKSSRRILREKLFSLQPLLPVHSIGHGPLRSLEMFRIHSGQLCLKKRSFFFLSFAKCPTNHSAKRRESPGFENIITAWQTFPSQIPYLYFSKQLMLKHDAGEKKNICNQIENQN